jgi:hypothetical protein
VRQETFLATVDLAARALRHFCVETHSTDFALGVVFDVDVNVMWVSLSLIIVFGAHFDAGKLHGELNRLIITSSLLKYFPS